MQHFVGGRINLLGKWSKFVGEMKQMDGEMKQYVFGRCPQANVNTTLYDTSHCHYCPNPRMCLSSTAPLLLQHWKFWLISEIRSKIRFKIKHSIRHLRVIQQTIMISARLQWVVGCWRPRAGWRETALLGSKIASHRVDKVSSVTTYSSQKMNYRFTLSGCIPKCDQCGTMLRSKKGLRI